MDFPGLYGRGFGPEKSMGETAVAEASGPPEAGVKPALFWVALVLTLVAVRIIYERAE
jgi:hypothetical protein